MMKVLLIMMCLLSSINLYAENDFEAIQGPNWTGLRVKIQGELVRVCENLESECVRDLSEKYEVGYCADDCSSGFVVSPMDCGNDCSDEIEYRSNMLSYKKLSFALIELRKIED